MKINNILIMFAVFTALDGCGQKNGVDQISSQDLILFNKYESKSAAYQQLPADSAVHFASLALGIARRKSYLKGEVLILDRLAKINEHYGNLKLAIRCQKEAIRIGSHVIEKRALWQMNANLGVLNAKSRDFKSSELLLLDALAGFKSVDLINDVRQTHVKLGDIYTLQKRYRKALTHYLTAENMYNEQNVSQPYFELLSRIGGIFTKLGSLQKALQYYQKGIDISSDESNLSTRSTFFRLAAQTLDDLGDRKKAMQYHQQGLATIRRSNQPDEQEIRLLISLAKMAQDEDADLGIRHLKNALEISKAIRNKGLTAEIYHSLNVIYRQQEQYQQAIVALDAFHSLSDSLILINSGHRIAVLQSSYELLETKAHLQELRMENQQRTIERDLYLMVVVVVVLFLFAGAVYIYKIRNLNRQLRETIAVRDKLFSIIGHDLRNPIGGMTQLLAIAQETEIATKEQQEILSMAKHQGEVSLEILNSLLLWGQTQLKGIVVDSVTFTPFVVVSKNTEILSKQLQDKALTIINSIPEDLTICGDVNHFDFVIRNLLSNAIKFSFAAGEIQIAADAHANTDKVVFSVRDFGKGIGAKQIQNFSSGSLDISYGTKGEKGTGFGLMLSKEFVNANKGRLWVESEEGKGTTFYFCFNKN